MSQKAESIGGSQHNFYLPLYNGAQSGDWGSAKSFIDHDSNALTARITLNAQTILHVSAICCQWGFVLKLLELLSSESTTVQDKFGYTVLHFAAQAGSLKTAKALVQKNPNLPQIASKGGDLPLFLSIFSESKEMMWYLSLITKVESPSSPFFNPSLPSVLRTLIESGLLDVALYFIQRFPELALADDASETPMLWRLANKPSYFFSGSNLGFVERWIYKFVHVETKHSPTHLVAVNSTESFPASQPRSFVAQVLPWFKRFFCKAIARLAPSIKMVRDRKLQHQCAAELVIHVCKQHSSMSIDQQVRYFLRNSNSILGMATRNGTEELVRSVLQYFPELDYNIVMTGRNILQAIQFRQEKIVNLLKERSPTIAKNLCSKAPEPEKSTLHLAGKLAPAFKLFSVSGAALQMQRELQWFKEVEKITIPFERELRDINDQTANDVFREEHKELAEQGEKWMKDTSNSCMLVSTLIATVLFAAAFTVPGGNVNDKGVPIFLHMDSFVVFAISDALGLFSSLTSLLMFLAILTARYMVEDFLESLPKKLIIGLGSLFFAIAAMIIAFGAALSIVLSERWHWVSVPITLLASFPVAMFVMLQLPLFIQMVQATYGSSIFRPWPSRL